MEAPLIITVCEISRNELILFFMLFASSCMVWNLDPMDKQKQPTYPPPPSSLQSSYCHCAQNPFRKKMVIENVRIWLMQNTVNSRGRGWKKKKKSTCLEELISPAFESRCWRTGESRSSRDGWRWVARWRWGSVFPSGSNGPRFPWRRFHWEV